MFRKTLGLLGALLLLGYSGIGSAHEEDADNWGGSFGISSNFMYRGISFSNDDYTSFGSFDWSNGNWFAGIYGIALVDQDGSGYDTEIDYYFGYASSAGKLDWFIQPIFYEYKDCTGPRVGQFFFGQGSLRCDFMEVWFDATYPIGDYVTLHGWYAYTPDFEFESGTGHYGWLDINLALGDSGISLNLGAGHQEIEGGKYSDVFGAAFGAGDYGWHYVNYIYGLNASWAGFDFDLSYHDTDSDGPNDSLRNYTVAEFTDDELVFTVSRVFD